MKAYIIFYVAGDLNTIKTFCATLNIFILLTLISMSIIHIMHCCVSLQQWLSEGVAVLRCTCLSCAVVECLQLHTLVPQDTAVADGSVPSV
jgi:hypothetical protein